MQILSMKQFRIPFTFIILYGLLKSFDLFFDGNDDLLFNVFVNRLFLRFSLILLLIILSLKLAKSKISLVKILSGNFFTVIILIGVLELFSFLFLNYYSYESKKSKPSYILFYENPDFRALSDTTKRIYGDFIPMLGRWRRPNKRIENVRCGDSLSILYSSNDNGARDSNRTSKGKNRTIVLGDSFLEGVLIDEKNRFSNLLEQQTGNEYLNFAINGANPTSYYQIYKTLVKDKYEHDNIIVGIYTGNDFDTFNKPIDGTLIDNPIYRVYWDNNRIKPTLANVENSSESFFTIKEPKSLRTTRDSLYNSLSWSRKILVELQTGSQLFGFVKFMSFKLAQKKNTYVSPYIFPQFEDPSRIDFIKSLDYLITSAKDKKITLMIIPDRRDFNESNITSGTSHYFNFLKNRYNSKNIQIIDLMPYFIKESGLPEELFIPCDGHWNEKGNAVAAKSILSISK